MSGTSRVQLQIPAPAEHRRGSLVHPARGALGWGRTRRWSRKPSIPRSAVRPAGARVEPLAPGDRLRDDVARRRPAPPARPPLGFSGPPRRPQPASPRGAARPPSAPTRAAARPGGDDPPAGAQPPPRAPAPPAHERRALARARVLTGPHGWRETIR